jgi:hypothetical protein
LTFPDFGLEELWTILAPMLKKSLLWADDFEQ